MAGRLRLCYLLPVYDAHAASHHVHLYELIAELVRDVEVHIVARSRESSCAIPGVAGYELVSGESTFARLWQYAGALLRAHRAGYCTFYIHYQIYPALLALALTRLCGGEVLFWSCVEMRARSGASERTLKRRILHWLRVDVPMRLVIRSADRLVTCSDVKARHYAEDFGLSSRRVAVVHNWVNIRRFRRDTAAGAELRRSLEIPPGHRVVLFLHVLGEHRGAHRLPEIIGQTLEALPQSTFVIAGDGLLRDSLRDSLRRAGLETSTRMVGAVPNTQVPQYMSASDVLINPAPWEAFGRILLEAMAAELPFVSTDGGRGGTRAFTTPLQQRFITPPNDVDAFVAALVELLLYPEIHEAMAAEGVRHIERFSTAAAAKAFAGVVQEVISESDNH